MSSTIRIIGLANTQTEQLSPEIMASLAKVREIYVKSTKITPFKQFSAPCHYIEPAFEAETGLADGYQSLADTLIKAAPVAYLVPGDPLLDEASVPVIQKMAQTQNIPVKLEPGLAQLPHLLQKLGLTPSAGLQILDATLLCSHHYPPLEPSRPVFITGPLSPKITTTFKKCLKQTLLTSNGSYHIARWPENGLRYSKFICSVYGYFYPLRPSAGWFNRLSKYYCPLTCASGLPLG